MSSDTSLRPGGDDLGRTQQVMDPALDWLNGLGTDTGAGPSTYTLPLAPPPAPFDPLQDVSQWHFSPQGNSTGSDLTLEQLFNADPFFDLSFLNGLGGDTGQAASSGATGDGVGGPGIAAELMDWNALSGSAQDVGTDGSRGEGEKARATRFKVPYFRYAQPLPVLPRCARQS